MSTGEGTGTGYSTMRGRNYPSIRQFTVFLENRVGQLLEVYRSFQGSRVKIVGLTISDSADCSILRLILSSWRGRCIGTLRFCPPHRRTSGTPVKLFL